MELLEWSSMYQKKPSTLLLTISAFFSVLSAHALTSKKSTPPARATASIIEERPTLNPCGLKKFDSNTHFKDIVSAMIKDCNEKKVLFNGSTISLVQRRMVKQNNKAVIQEFWRDVFEVTYQGGSKGDEFTVWGPEMSVQDALAEMSDLSINKEHYISAVDIANRYCNSSKLWNNRWNLPYHEDVKNLVGTEKLPDSKEYKDLKKTSKLYLTMQPGEGFSPSPLIEGIAPRANILVRIDMESERTLDFKNTFFHCVARGGSLK